MGATELHDTTTSDSSPRPAVRTMFMGTLQRPRRSQAWCQSRSFCQRQERRVPPHRFGLVRAEGLLGEEAAGGGVGAGAAAAAECLVAAVVALAFERRRIAQVAEYRRVVPDSGEALRPGVAGVDREIAAGIDAALVRDEADARAGEAAARHRRQRLAVAGACMTVRG